MIGTRPAAVSTAKRMASRCSASVSVEPSPVVPAMTRASMPSSICQSIRRLNCAKSMPSRVRGVISAVAAPRKMEFCFMGVCRPFRGMCNKKIADVRRLLNCGDRKERPCSAMAISIALRDCDSHAGYSPHAQMNVRLIHLRRSPLSHPAGPAKTVAPKATVDKPRLYSQIAYPVFLIIACFEVPVNSGRES